MTKPRSGSGILSACSICSSGMPASDLTRSGSPSPASVFRSVRTAFRACLESGETTLVSEIWIIVAPPDPPS